jgi:phosphoglycerol transferase
MNQETNNKISEEITENKEGCSAVPEKNQKDVAKIVVMVVCGVLLFIGALLACAADWYIRVYGDVGFDSILFTLFADMDGVNQGIVWRFIFGVILPALIISAVLMLALFFKPKKSFAFSTKKGKKFEIYPFKKVICVVLSVMLCCGLTVFAADKSGLFRHLRLASQETEIYEQKFVDPKTVNIEFPKDKQNLIVIFLESVETTFVTTDKGGAREVDLIPELYELAQENLNFSHNDSFGGASTLTGGTWTIGAMVSQTSGIPLQIPSDISDHNNYGQESFLPGVTSLSDILHENGYYQALMVGSDAKFGGRRQYYEQHGTDAIFDLFTAREEGIIPDDYYVWWGMEDEYLFQYAKQELTNISKQEKPFAFTMLTVDTHAWGGYICDLCGDEYEKQYDNVYTCASKQIYDFVRWIQEQPFYENTTVVITSDHLTMDSEYITRTVDEGYDRRVYNCFINSRVEPEQAKNRDFSTLDMLPTILASLGCKIDGNRLGLGTNLFSHAPTLCEIMGKDALNDELSKRSEYYDNFYYLNDSNEE